MIVQGCRYEIVGFLKCVMRWLAQHCFLNATFFISTDCNFLRKRFYKQKIKHQQQVKLKKGIYLGYRYIFIVYNKIVIGFRN